MKLKDLIDSHHWDEITKRMKKLYPKSKKSIKGYEKVFYYLKATEPKPQGKRKILIELEPAHNKEDDKYYTYVHGITPKRRGSEYSLMLTPWEEWLDMEICEATLYNYTNIDIICHCLWEMTFTGFEPGSNKILIEVLKKAKKEL